MPCSPITSGNYGSATLIASHVFNNSGQLFGGDPSISGGNAFTQANRQDAGLPMSILAFGGSALPAYSGLQIYTPTGTQSAYYAVVGNPQPSGSDSYIGSFGPVAETAGTVVPIKYADSLSRGVNYGKITAPTGIPVIFNAHPSGSSGGAPGRCINGDYWEWFLPPQDGYQDGRATVQAANARAARAGLAFVAGLGGVVEIGAAGPLQQVAAGRGLVAQLA